jgi:hypothetical protein
MQQSKAGFNKCVKCTNGFWKVSLIFLKYRKFHTFLKILFPHGLLPMASSFNLSLQQPFMRFLAQVMGCEQDFRNTLQLHQLSPTDETEGLKDLSF